MQITSRFTVAIHTLICIAHYEGIKKVTSNLLASSIGADATIIRRLISQLQTAGIITVKAGIGGAYLTKKLSEITLFDLFKAINANQDNFFKFYDNPNCTCPVGNNIHAVLDSHLNDIQEAMYKKMQGINLQTLYDEIKPLLDK